MNNKSSADKTSGALLFVVQKHATVRPHFDLRLQIGESMPSWAVPRGPTLDPTLKRLAMETTEHDMEYRHFEGVIPQGEYGAGTVMIWDEGIYIAEVEITRGIREQVKDIQDAQRVMKEGLVKGELKFFLKGKKLQGSFALVKTRGFGPKNSWLLIKHKDKYIKPAFDANDYNFSVVSKRAFDKIT